LSTTRDFGAGPQLVIKCYKWICTYMIIYIYISIDLLGYIPIYGDYILRWLQPLVSTQLHPYVACVSLDCPKSA
jgi:hypothetical protein